MADEQKFLSELQSDAADTRFAAWRKAGEVSPSVIPQLGKLAASATPGVGKAGREALTTMVHAAGKDPSNPNRPAIVKGLLQLTSKEYDLPVRVHAMRLLSNIAGPDAVPAIARHLGEPDLREEAVYTLERIPGEASAKALVAGYKDAKDDFKPRMLAALGHRRVADATPVCMEAMRSNNKEIAVAAVKAFGRIGRKPSGTFRPPEPGGATEWEKVDIMDSALRYADAQAKEGDAAEAMRVYKLALERQEPHWQCAAVIGLAKMNTPEAALAIFPKLKSDNRTVRITAENAWKTMAVPVKA